MIGNVLHLWIAAAITLVCVIGGCETPPASSKSSPQQASASVAPLDPTVNEYLFDREVKLHASLYRAAHQNMVGPGTRIELDPVIDETTPVVESAAELLRERVLAQLADLTPAVQWRPVDWRDRLEEGTTYLRITIHKRDEAQATVTGDFSDLTPGAASSRQGFTAIWDGQRWRVERAAARSVW